MIDALLDYFKGATAREAFAWGIVLGGSLTTLAWLWFA